MKIMSFNTQHCFNYIERKIDFEIVAKAILDAYFGFTTGSNESFENGLG